MYQKIGQEFYFGNPLGKLILQDSHYLNNIKVSVLDIDFRNTDIDEFQYYIHNVGFRLVYLMELIDELFQTALHLKTLKIGKVFKDKGFSRGNIVKYFYFDFLSRLKAVEDRVLQLINALYHLGIDETQVRKNLILKNVHLRDKKIKIEFQALSTLINKYSKGRNTAIHIHTSLRKDIKLIEMFYQNWSKINRQLNMQRIRVCKRCGSELN